jgi:hypothetical protein
MRWAGHVARMGEERNVYRFRVVFWDILPCKMIVDRRFRGAYCQHHTRRRENLKSHSVYRVLMGKPERYRPLGRPRRRWEDGIRMDLR